MSPSSEEGRTTARPTPPTIDDASKVRQVPAMKILQPGDELAGFRIEAMVGRGGMGLVYRARQHRPARLVAIKVISPDLVTDPAFRLRFEQEAAIAAQIEHQNVIPVYEVGDHDGLLYIAMRFIDGVDLGGVLAREGRLEPSYAARMIGQVADALDAAHARGLVHRDVKPGNVLVTPGNHAYLTDFGLTKLTTDVSGLTRSGAFVGTVDYIAPEQVRGHHVDARADVYALGCVAYQLLAGRVPFERDSQIAVIVAHVNDPPPRLTGVAAPLADAVVRAMAKNPDERFLSAGDFGRAVSAGALGRRDPGAGRSVATGAAAIAIGATTINQGGPAPTQPAGTTAATRERQAATPTQLTPGLANEDRGKNGRSARRGWIIAAGVVILLAAVGAGMAAALGGGGAGGGNTSPAGQIGATVETYLTAVADGDGATACAQLTPGAQSEVVEKAPSGAKTCADAIGSESRSISPSYRSVLLAAIVSNVQVNGGLATATVQGAPATLSFTKVGGRWLINGGSVNLLLSGKTSGSSGAGLAHGTPTPPSTTTHSNTNQCVLTINDPFAQIQATPGYPPQSGTKVPAGSYVTITSEVLSFAGVQTRWYEIHVGGQTGWIVDDNVQIQSKSSGCPVS